MAPLEGGNNGIGIRTPFGGHGSTEGMEIQVLDDESEKYKGRLKPTQYTGSIYDVFPARPGFVKRDGAWNSFEITAAGSHVKVVLNGETVVDADLASVTDEAVLRSTPACAVPAAVSACSATAHTSSSATSAYANCKRPEPAAHQDTSGFDVPQLHGFRLLQ